MRETKKGKREKEKKHTKKKPQLPRGKLRGSNMMNVGFGGLSWKVWDWGKSAQERRWGRGPQTRLRRGLHAAAECRKKERGDPWIGTPRTKPKICARRKSKNA